MARKINLEEIDLQIDDVLFWEPYERNNGGVRINWSATIGYGRLDIVHEEDGTITASTEYMDKGEDKEFTKLVLSKLLEKIVIKD